ncbi:hypothetical protein Btru_044609, partial [Bulinus truncatus]
SMQGRSLDEFHSLFQYADKMQLGNVLFVFIVASLALTQAQSPELLDVLKADGHFNTVLDLLQTSGFLSQINASTHFTIFAPTDEALARLPAGTIDSLKADTAKLNDIIAYHVILNSTFYVQATQQDTVLTSSNHHQIRINTYQLVHSQTVEGINITQRNIRVNHGIVHRIDGFMIPPGGNIIELGNTIPNISTFESLIKSANMTTYFTFDRSTTIFVPNDAAFAKVSPDVMSYLQSHPAALTDTLKYHVIREYSLYSIGMAHSLTVHSGDLHMDNLMILKDTSGGLSVNNAKILTTDIGSVNGVVHIIDTVLVPPRVLVAIADQGIVVG